MTPLTENFRVPQRHTAQDRLKRRRYRMRHKRAMRGRRKRRLTPNQRRAIQRLKSSGFYKKLARFQPHRPHVGHRAVRRRHESVEFADLVLETAAEMRLDGVDEASVVDFVASFLARPTDVAKTPSGISALMLEAALADNDALWNKFVDCEIADDSTYYAVFDSEVTEADVRWIEEASEHFAESVTLIVEKGMELPDDEDTVSDFSVVEIVSKPQPYLQPDAHDVEGLNNSGGMSECQFIAAYGAPTDEGVARTHDGVWERRSGAWKLVERVSVDGTPRLYRLDHRIALDREALARGVHPLSHRGHLTGRARMRIQQTLAHLIDLRSQGAHAESVAEAADTDDGGDGGDDSQGVANRDTTGTSVIDRSLPIILSATFESVEALRAAYAVLEAEGINGMRTRDRIILRFSTRAEADIASSLLSANFHGVTVKIVGEEDDASGETPDDYERGSDTRNPSNATD